jgi:hypothetical protein
MIITEELEPRLQKLVDLGESGTNIIHGELKNLMYETENNMVDAQNDEPLAEDEYYESDDYYNGYLDALTHVYQLTYQLAFAINERTKARG